MPKQEQGPQPGNIRAKMFEFMSLGPTNGINNFTLKGPVNVRTILKGFVGIFPTLGKPGIAVSTEDPQTASASYLYGATLATEIPERIQALQMADKPEVRSFFELRSLMSGTPYIMALIGEAEVSKEEIVVLFAVNGISPETALRELKERIREREDKRRRDKSDLN